MRRPSLLPCGLLILLTACLPTFGTPTLTPAPAVFVPSPLTATALPPSTVIQPPASATITPTPPPATPTPPPPPTGTPQPLPTLQPAVTPDETPLQQPAADSAAIQFLSPGPLSKVVSPIPVHGYAVPGHDGKAKLDLFGEDGNLLASQVLNLFTPYKWALYYYEMAFKISSVGELARLSLTTIDEFGRVSGVNSVHLLLFAQGESILNPPGNLQERVVIEKPIPGQHIGGGRLGLEGHMLPYNSLPLTVELQSRDGSLIAKNLVPLPASQDGSYIPFKVDLDYAIPSPLYVLLSISQFDDRISGLMYLYSQEILINP